MEPPASSAADAKWARLLLRELYDQGYSQAAHALESEAGVRLRSAAMEALSKCLDAQDWDAALELVTAQKLQMRSLQAAREAKLLLLQRKFVAFLLQKELNQALNTFQEQILPLCAPNEEEVVKLAELLLCGDEEQMRGRARVLWQDQEMRDRMEQLVSAEEIIPQGALRRLVQEQQMELKTPPSMMQGQVTAECTHVLAKQKGDVWALAFAPDGKLLASAASDGSVVLWEVDDQMSEPLHVFQSVDGPVECLAWSPDSRFLLAGGRRTSIIQLWDRVTGMFEKRFQHPTAAVTNIEWLPCGDQFLSGSADKSLVLWNATQESIAYQWSGRRALDLAVHPHESKVFVLVSSYEIRAYDIATKTDELFFEAEQLVSCIAISQSGRFLVVNFMKQEQVACVEIATASIVSKYSGIREQRYVLRPCFAGTHNEIVACGSEDGKIYLWQRDSATLLAGLDGHASAVNVVVRNPVHSNVLASASDDESVRLWRLKSSE